jgi:hypothetical protein
MTYHLTCLHCGARLTTTPRVEDPEVAAVERHLQTDHGDTVPADRRLDYAEVLGHVRVQMGD